MAKRLRYNIINFMIKKILYTFLLVCVIFLLNSCWIYPDYKDYEEVNNTYYFDDYETMKSVIIPMINTSFKDWHWNGDEFDKKYDKYFGNIAANEEAYQTLLKKKSKYAVRNDKSLKADINGVNQSISECYWITTKDNKGVVFYQK